jgi:hypothetical protein
MSGKARVFVDGHVHIYPNYDLTKVLQNGINNLNFSAKKLLLLNSKEGENYSGCHIAIWLLTERFDCNFFEEVKNAPSKFGNDNFRFLSGNEKETIIVEQAGKPILCILSGRQIVTREGLEVLSLISTLFLKDREKTIDDVIQNIVASGGLAALNWAPGKWFFSRGKVVRRIIEEYFPESLFICDTSLRNTLWPLPKLMVDAQKRSFKVIAGSDPLPFYNEEKYIGSYGFCVVGDFNINYPAESIRLLLKKPEKNVSLIGNRNDFVTFVQRQFKIMTKQIMLKYSSNKN